ncbi:unnamed protein product [Ixodes hexagonus]
MCSVEMNNLLKCTNMEQMYFDLLSGPLLEDDDEELFGTLLEGELPFDLLNAVEDMDTELVLGTEVVPEIDSAEEEVDVVSIDDDKASAAEVLPPPPPQETERPPTPKTPKKLLEDAPVVSSSLLDRMKAASTKKKGPILIQPPDRGRPITKSDAMVQACPAATPDHDYCTGSAAAKDRGSRKVQEDADQQPPNKNGHVLRRPVSRSPSPPKRCRSPHGRSMSRQSMRSSWSRGSRSSSPSSRSSSCGSSDGSVRRYSRPSRKPRDSRDARNSRRPHRRHRQPLRMMPSPPRRRGPEGQKEERRVIYVGNIPEGTTRTDLRQRFAPFGPIEEVSVHFRDRGDNYGFVTFMQSRDAYEAVEHGNDDPKLPRFDLCFGGRRQFCRTNWADLDSQYERYYYIQRQPQSDSIDFDSLLQAAKTQPRGHRY